MNKKIISLLLAIAMLISLIPGVVFTANAVAAGIGTRKMEGGKRDFRWPVPNNYGISGCYMDQRNHYAIDIPAGKGTSVVASYPGTVVATYTSCTHNYSKTSTCCGDGFGNYVVLQHSYTRSDGSSITLYSRYSHLTAVSVSKGQSVSVGTQVGTVGSTGYSQGNHLDFQILQNTWTSRASNGLDPYINDLLELPSSIRAACSSSCAGVGPTDCCCYWYIQHVKNQYATPISHDCDKGTYKYPQDAHPHYKCYACSVCGKINEFRDETVPSNTCDQCRPGKPVLKVNVDDEGVATFTWNETANTTHYNVWLAKKNAGGDWESIEQVFEAESGFQRTFEEGEYQAQLLSYSSKMWEPDGSDWVHTWGEDVYFSVVDECRHNYTSKHVDATCVDYGYTTYTCSLCGDTYTMYDGDYTEWSTTKPSGVDEALIETKLQYRYADKETTTSYESSLSGWTQVGGEWQQSGTGSVTYVKSWPSGFLTSHSLYGTYNKTPKSASETNTNKTTINSDKTTGYLYYHWCRGEYQNGPDNRKSKPSKQEDCDTFCAFYSTTSPSSLTAASDGDGSYKFSKPECCKDSYWYFYTPVNTQNYTTYRKLFTYERWDDWSDWSDTVYTASSSRKVEKRTLYRAVEVELGDHDYQDGYCTVCGDEDPNYNFVPVILGVADVSAAPGDTVTIPVTISDNTGFAGFTLCIDYDESVMTLTNISKGSLLNSSESGAFTKNVSGKTINWVDSANITGDGELMKLTFTINGAATPGSYAVELNLKNGKASNFVDEKSRALHVEFESGIVSVQAHAPAVTLEKIEIATKPTKTVYRIGEALDTSGLTLKATYSDGTTKNITGGFTVSGFDSVTAGTKTVTVSYEGKKTTFTVTVKQEEIDPDAPKLVIASVNAAAGETVTVEARLEKNPGISSFSVKIDYDTTRLKLENAEFGPEIGASAFVNYNLPYIAFVRSSDCEGDVVLATLTFTVLQNAEEGDAYVTMEYNEGDIANSDEEDVNFTVVSGCVTVVDYVPGDINGDRKVNSKDLTRLLKYISHEDVEVNEAALDVNGDGKVNSKDLTRLLKYISHEDVEIH